MRPHDDHKVYIPIPHAKTAIPTTILLLFILLFILLSIFNLSRITTLTWFGISASLAWPVLVTAVIWMSIHEDGVYKLRVDLMGCYSRHHFVEATQLKDGSTVICLGYQLFNRKWYYWNVKTSSIVSVCWNTGQATDMAGRDMKDWLVVMWYQDSDKPERSTKLSPRANYDLHGIGPSRAREKTEALGLAYVEFLRSIGLDMVATEKDTEFNVMGKSLPSYENADSDAENTSST